VANENFEVFLNELKRKTKQSLFKTLFSPLQFVELKGNTLRIRTKDKVAKHLIAKHHIQALKEAARTAFKKDVEIELLAPEELDKPKQLELDLKPAKEKKKIPSNLNPKYTFENFVVGASNQFAHAAAMAVAENPGKAYNPLFIYGGVGLGKTHLMQAIGNYILQHLPEKTVVYVTTETFINQLIEALKSDNIQQFKETYRNVDVLLIDDIQFISGKERTQIEFFHTFNALYDAGKQVVLTSDRPPKDILTLTERLRSRFEWGLIADIQPPDFETRVAILKRKAEEENVEISDEVIKFLATIIKSNIRQLEGALIKLKAKATLEGKPITKKLVRELFSTEVNSPQQIKLQEIYIQTIKEVVSSEFQIDPKLLESPVRKKRVALARQIAMYLAKKIGNFSYTHIAISFKRDDHTTVMHAVKKVEDLRQKDNFINSLISKLEDEVKNALKELP